MLNKKQMANRILAAFCVLVLAAVQVFVLVPSMSSKQAHGATAGNVLDVRVQYYGESGNKIRTKASFTRAQLEAMGAQTWYYSNVTKVGTVMSMAAYGPEVTTIIETAGIDLGSIQNVTFRTTDGYTRNFTVGGHLTDTRYFYPNLSSLYERCDDGETLVPQLDSLEGAVQVPAILALKYGESKMPGTIAEDLSMSTSKTYRFCLGQTPLVEGQKTRPGYDGGDVTSMDSCHSIYGIDVTLAGSPVKGLDLDIEDRNLKVGSKKKISATVLGDELFVGDYKASDLQWSSSDTSIATVDKNGNVTILKKGEVTITATAPNGVSASITINGTDGKKKDSDKDKDKKQETAGNKNQNKNRPQHKTTDKAKATKKVKKPVEARTITVKEITLGDEIVPETSMVDEAREESMAEDADALGEGEKYSKGVAAGTAMAFGAFGAAGVVFRIRRYRIDK